VGESCGPASSSSRIISARSFFCFAFIAFFLAQVKNKRGGFKPEWRVHINLIEVNIEDIGRAKKLDHIAGCLIAYACAISFKKGYGGFVSLTPKTKLIGLYQNKYGFRQFGRMLAVQFEFSERLMKKYLGDEEI